MKNLNKFGIRNTDLHRSLYAAFENSNKAICSNDLKELIAMDFNPASLYRAINRFLSAGLIRVTYVHEKEGAYYQLSSSHEHFIICRECGTQEKLTECSIGPMIKDAKKLGFTNLEHRLEINGECAKCG